MISWGSVADKEINCRQSRDHFSSFTPSKQYLDSSTSLIKFRFPLLQPIFPPFPPRYPFVSCSECGLKDFVGPSVCFIARLLVRS